MVSGSIYRVGLTGGVASGKSTISQLFTDLGVEIIETDIISHQLMQPGQAAYLQTIEHFGPKILAPDKTINRQRLRKIVFSQASQKKWLEQMIHPLIRQQTRRQISAQDHGEYVLVVVPLMFETGFNQLVDHVIAIDCPTATQIQRLIRRDHIDTELAQKMIAAQMDNSSRLSLADSIIPNRDNKSRQPDVFILHKKLLKLANRASNSKSRPT